MKKAYLISFLFCSLFSFSMELPTILAEADKVKESSTELFFDGILSVDLNGNSITDQINYTYSDFPPKFIIDVTIDNERKEVGLICNSIGVFREKTKGMINLFCGPKFKLIWNGNAYKDINIESIEMKNTTSQVIK